MKLNYYYYAIVEWTKCVCSFFNSNTIKVLLLPFEYTKELARTVKAQCLQWLLKKSMINDRV